MIKIQNSLMDKERIKTRSEKWFFNIFCFVLLIICLFTFISKVAFIRVLVDGASMSPTLKSGDVLFVTETDNIEVGDIVVIDGEKVNGKGGYDWLIKRVIAIGEKDKTVVVEIKDGGVFVGYKGEALNRIKEDYLPSGTITNPTVSLSQKLPYWELEEGQVFFLGDNRSNSEDSRGKYDLCEKSQIVGVVRNWAISLRWLSGFMFDVGQRINNLF